MLDWLLDVVLPVRCEAPEFGSLRYLRQVRWWEGKGRFQGAAIEWLVHAPRSGPDAQQAAFVRELADRYASMLPGIERAMRSTVDDEGLVQPASLQLAHIEVPAIPGSEARWSMSYDGLPERTLEVMMIGWAVADVVVAR